MSPPRGGRLALAALAALAAELGDEGQADAPRLLQALSAVPHSSRKPGVVSFRQASGNTVSPRQRTPHASHEARDTGTGDRGGSYAQSDYLREGLGRACIFIACHPYPPPMTGA